MPTEKKLEAYKIDEVQKKMDALYDSFNEKTNTPEGVDILLKNLQNLLDSAGKDIKEILTEESPKVLDKDLRLSLMSSKDRSVYKLQKEGKSTLEIAGIVAIIQTDEKKWPNPTVSRLCDWRIITKDIDISPEYDIEVTKALIDSYESDKLDIVLINSIWELADAYSIIRQKMEPIEELVYRWKDAGGIHGINHPEIRDSAEALNKILQVYTEVSERIWTQMKDLHTNIKNETLSYTEKSRFEEDDWL